MSRKGGSLIPILVLAVVVGAAVYFRYRRNPDQPPANRRVAVPDAAVLRLATANAEFALELYRAAAASQSGNPVLSPYGVSMVLGMIRAAAEGETAIELNRVCHLLMPDDGSPEAYGNLDGVLAAGARGKTTWKAQQSLWTGKSYQVRPDYQSLLTTDFGASVESTDFGSPKRAADDINEWVKEATDGEIESLANPDMFSNLTVLALLSANLFHGEWAVPFEPEATRPQTFHTASGDVQADMMHQSVEHRFVETDALQAIELPYRDGPLSMLVILPAGKLDQTFRDDLTPSELQQILGGLSSQEVALHLPRFKAASLWNLIEPLQALGLRRVFEDGKAELAMADGAKPHVSVFIQRAAAEVDEAGAKMTSATMAVATDAAMAPTSPPAEMICDRPFLYLLRDQMTGSILFIGEVADPTAG